MNFLSYLWDRNSKKIIKCIISYLTIISLFSLILIGCNEEKQAYYATIHEAQKDNAFKRGWIPTIIPQSAVNIYERHFIDLNYVWLKFDFNTNDVPNFLANCKAMNLEEIRAINKEVWGVPKWWPEMLTAKKIEKLKDGFPFLVAKYEYQIEYGNNRKQDMHGYFFINTKSGEIYYIGGIGN